MGIVADFPEHVKSGFEFYRKQSDGDEYTDAVETYAVSPHVTCDGVLRHLSGGKRYVASVHGFDADYRFYADPPVDIAVGDRMTFDGEAYEVKAVNDVLGKGELLQVDMLWLSTEPKEVE